jgi:hypothetical protein
MTMQAHVGASDRSKKDASILLPGAWVEVLPAAEIVRTLDADQALEGLPFMPEMLPHCGQRYRVALRAERTCINPPEVPFRRLQNAVVLEGLRCDGSLHGGCELGCMLLWKEAWLRRVPAGAAATAAGHAVGPAAGSEDTPRLLATVGDDPERFFCQATELPRATEPGEPIWKPGQYLGFLRMRTLTLRELLVQFGRPVARRVRWFAASLDPRPKPPPVAVDAHLGLQPGEWVEVRSKEEILQTLDAHGANRGLVFSTDMYRLSGQRMQVERRLDRVIVEATGRLRTVRDTVVLEGDYCQRYRGCARGMPIYWREAWLKRVESVPPGDRKGEVGLVTDQPAK